MLKSVHEERMIEQLPIGDATFPVPFPHSLEFNPPVHGTKNIVHMGMGMPEAHQIYVCAINCMRGVVLTAAEMNAADRFSCVVFREEDVLLGRVEDVTIEGVIDVLKKLPYRPKAAIVFPVCTHHFLGCNLDYIYSRLEEAYPDIYFYRGLMDPIKQKEGLTPDQKLRKEMVSQLKTDVVKKKLALLGNNYALRPTNEINRICQMIGAEFVQMQDCRTYAEFEALGEAAVYVSTVPNGVIAAEAAAKKDNRKSLYLPASPSLEECEKELVQLTESLIELLDLEHAKGPTKEDPLAWDAAGARKFVGTILNVERSRTLGALAKTKKLVGDTPIYIDYSVHPRPLGLARLLLSHGFNVKGVYANAFNLEEEEDFRWLQIYAPSLPVIMTIHPGGRVRTRGSEEKTLALGQMAAWYQDTRHFVNIVEGGGLWGFSGIQELCTLMQDAYKNEKDTRQIVPRKGLGCDSCV